MSPLFKALAQLEVTSADSKKAIKKKKTAESEKFHNSIADRNEAIYDLSEKGHSHEKIAKKLGIDTQIVKNFLGK